ncbi:MAG: N-acetylmuramoyl-L-alanine amidase [Candidatus Omnitrophica bacterium]|nr:N-acetylmuramoyl-L-alanine amidase [Candidatus Omnitrophota bacterium]
MRIFKFILVAFILFLAGCATTPSGSLPAYCLNGTSYYSLKSLCDLRGVRMDYDSFARRVILNKGNYNIHLRVGDELILVNGQPKSLNKPVDFYQGAVVVPRSFKENIIDGLFNQALPVKKQVASLKKIKKAVIDPGHGGHDPGAIGRTGLKEKEVNLDIAKRLANLLRSAGVEVLMTRTSDRFIPLPDRIGMANSANADLFISVHANANPSRKLCGFEVYYVAPSVSDSSRAVSAAKSAPLHIESSCFASNSHNLKAIVWDMIFTQARAESIELSRSICRSTDANMDVRIIGVKAARFQVLKGARMPAVLVEVGFLSNREEEGKLKSGYYRQKIAEGIMDGIRNYGGGR